MATHNPNNERVKHRYFAYLKEADRYSEASVDAAAMALSRFELSTERRDFGAFHVEQAIAFKRRLAEQRSQKRGQEAEQGDAPLHPGASQAVFPLVGTRRRACAVGGSRSRRRAAGSVGTPAPLALAVACWACSLRVYDRERALCPNWPLRQARHRSVCG